MKTYYCGDCQRLVNVFDKGLHDKSHTLIKVTVKFGWEDE